MRVVQVSFYKVVGVVAVRDGLVTAAGAVLVALVVFRIVAVVAFGVLAADLERVLLDGAVFFLVVQVPVVEIIHVAVVLYGGMPATLTVRVLVPLMYARHNLFLSFVFRPSLLVCVGEDREYYVVDVPVGERVVDVLAFPPTAHKTLGPQDLQPL